MLNNIIQFNTNCYLFRIDLLIYFKYLKRFLIGNSIFEARLYLIIASIVTVV